MKTRKTPLFLVLGSLSLITCLTISSTMSQMIHADKLGGFYVMMGIFVLFLLLSIYLFFLSFGQKLLLFEKIFEHSNDAIAIANEKGEYIWQNSSHAQLLGFENTSFLQQIAAFYINTKKVMLKEELDSIKEFSGNFKSITRDGFIDVFISAFRVEDTLGDTLCYVEMKREAKEYFRMIEQSQKEKERILNLAHTDPLTKLYNRLGFFERLEKQTHVMPQGSIIFADVDNFKSINDTYGHEIGDKVLQHISSIIQKTLRSSDLCARFGGEEFVLWIDADAQKSYEVAQKLCLKIAQMPFEKLFITCSFGVSRVEKHLDEAIKQADNAMYLAKKSGKNRVCLAP